MELNYIEAVIGLAFLAIKKATGLNFSNIEQKASNGLDLIWGTRSVMFHFMILIRKKSKKLAQGWT